MAVFSRFSGLLLAGVCFLLFGALSGLLQPYPRPSVSTEMQVVLPRFVQVLMAVGDRYLAADLAGFRALVVSTEKMSRESFAILARVHSDIAWLNPAHEDNYYIANAILPWNGYVQEAQEVLAQAAEARPFDMQPPYYYGLNAAHHMKDPAEAARWLQKAAERSLDDLEQIQVQQLAAHVAGRGDDLEQAIALHRMMAKGTRHKSFARFLEKRILRLENYRLIRDAATRYRDLYGQLPEGLGSLRQSGLLSEIPPDPFGLAYVLDKNGRAMAVELQGQK